MSNNKYNSMKKLVLLACVSLWASACNKTPHEEQQASMQNESTTKVKNVALDSDKDPICDMKVSKNYEDTTLYKGKVYGFCSVECKAQFKKDPEKYIQQ